MSWFHTRFVTKVIGTSDAETSAVMDSTAGLNDRLVQYVHQMRTLNMQNGALLKTMEKREICRVREFNSMKKNFEQKLADDEKLIQELLHDRSTLQIEKGIMKEDVEDLQKRFRL